MADAISLEAKSTALVVVDLQAGILALPTAPYSGEEDAIAARSVEEHAFVMRTVFPRIGRVRKTSEVVAAFAEARS